MVPVVELVACMAKYAKTIKSFFDQKAFDSWAKDSVISTFIEMDDSTYCKKLGPESILLVFTTNGYIDTFSVLNISYERFKDYVSKDTTLLLSAMNFSFMITASSPNISLQDTQACGDYDPSKKYDTSQEWIFENDGIVFDDYSQSVVMSNVTPLFHTPSGILIPPDIEEDEYFQLHVTHTIPPWDAFIRLKELIPYQSIFVENGFKISLHYDAVVADGDVELFERSIEIIEDAICSTGS